MVQRCCVCLKARSTVYNVSFYSFPTDSALKKSWIEAIPEPNFFPSSKLICSAHFKPEDQYIDETTGKAFLYPDVIPSVFLLTNPDLPVAVQLEKQNVDFPATNIHNTKKRKQNFPLNEFETPNYIKSSKNMALPGSSFKKLDAECPPPGNSLNENITQDVINGNVAYCSLTIDNGKSQKSEIGTAAASDMLVAMDVISTPNLDNSPTEVDSPAINASAIPVFNAASETVHEYPTHEENSSADFPAITVTLSSSGLKTDVDSSQLLCPETVEVKKEICDFDSESVTIKQEEINDYLNLSEQVSTFANDSEFISDELRFSPLVIPKTEISDLEKSITDASISGLTEGEKQNENCTDRRKITTPTKSIKPRKEYVYCCACRIGSDNKFGVTLHGFPTTKRAQARWTEILTMLQIVCKDVSKLHVCSQHFLSSDFMYTKGNYKLKRNSVPSLFNVELAHQRYVNEKANSTNLSRCIEKLNEKIANLEIGLNIMQSNLSSGTKSVISGPPPNLHRNATSLSKVEDKVFSIFNFLGLKENFKDSISERISTLYTYLMQDVEQPKVGTKPCNEINSSKLFKELNLVEDAESYFTISYEHASTLQEIVFASGESTYVFEKKSAQCKKCTPLEIKNKKLEVERDYAVELRNRHLLKVDRKMAELEEMNEQLTHENNLLNEQMIEIESLTASLTIPKRRKLQDEIIGLFGLPETICSEIVKKCIHVRRNYYGMRSYSDRVMNFSLLLYHHSKDAYKLVRKAFYNCLPEKSGLVNYMKKKTSSTVSESDVYNALKKMSMNDFIENLSDTLKGVDCSQEVDSPFDQTTAGTDNNFREDLLDAKFEVKMEELSSIPKHDATYSEASYEDSRNKNVDDEELLKNSDCDKNESETAMDSSSGNKYSEGTCDGSKNICEHTENVNSNNINTHNVHSGDNVKQPNDQIGSSHLSECSPEKFLPKDITKSSTISVNSLNNSGEKLKNVAKSDSLGIKQLQKFTKGTPVKRIHLNDRTKLNTGKGFSLPKSMVLNMIAKNRTLKVVQNVQNSAKCVTKTEGIIGSDSSLPSHNSNANLDIEQQSVLETCSSKFVPIAGSLPLKLTPITVKTPVSFQDTSTKLSSSDKVETAVEKDSDESNRDIVTVDMEII